MTKTSSTNINLTNIEDQMKGENVATLRVAGEKETEKTYKLFEILMSISDV